jgi:hypothetical protein
VFCILLSAFPKESLDADLLWSFLLLRHEDDPQDSSLNRVQKAEYRAIDCVPPYPSGYSFDLDSKRRQLSPSIALK